MATVVAAAALTIGTASGCGAKRAPDGVTDAAVEKVADTTPDWFPAFPPPPEGVIVEVIDRASRDNGIEYGRSVTWRVDRPYDDVIRDLDATLASLGWQPTDRLATDGEQDSRRTSIYIENGSVEVIRVYTDANLKGVRVTVELPV